LLGHRAKAGYWKVMEGPPRKVKRGCRIFVEVLVENRERTIPKTNKGGSFLTHVRTAEFRETVKGLVGGGSSALLWGGAWKEV